MRLVTTSLCFALVIACSGPTDSTDDPRPPKGDDPTDAGEPKRSVIERIEDWNAHLSASDREAKYCKMAASPFSFFRGTNHLFWEASWDESRLAPLSTPETQTWIQGDLHAANFGAFDNDEGVVVYDLNDFDEAIIADYQLDLWRMSASIVLLARANDNLSRGDLDDVLDEFVLAYIDAMVDYQTDETELEDDDREKKVTFSSGELSEPLRSFAEKVEERNEREESLDDWTRTRGGERELDMRLDELEPASPLELTAIGDALSDYGDSLSGGLPFDPNYFEIKSVAKRERAGNGSLGTPRYYLLIEGPSNDIDDDRILDLKRQDGPTPLAFADDSVRAAYASNFDNHAFRHARAYKALANDVDDHLGVFELVSLANDGHYSVRERSVFKKSFPVDSLKGDEYESVVQMWGLILATAHARADVDFDSNLITHSVDDAIAALTEGREDELSTTIRELGLRYANRAESEWKEFVSELAPADCP